MADVQLIIAILTVVFSLATILTCILTVLCDEYSLRESQKASGTSDKAVKGNQRKQEEV